MSKSIKVIILLFLAFGLSAAVAKFRKIPAPQIDLSQIKATSSGSKLTLTGRGFIKDFTKAHRIILKKKGAKKRFKIKALSSTPEELVLQLPEEISYGDYDLQIFLKTKFFKSKKQKFRNLVKIRPSAPSKPQLQFYVVKNKNELADIIDQNQEHDLILNLEEDLHPGINSLTSFYYKDGFKSLSSEAVNVFFLSEDDFRDSLEISSEKPLESFAKSIHQERLDVSEITNSTESGLTRTYHLMTPSDKSYLATYINLSPIFIAKAHIKSPEYIILKNRTKQDFNLNACHIDDELKTRYSFDDQAIISANAEFKVEGKLSLNDSGDTISIICREQVLDAIEYTKVDAEGFASN